MIKAQQTQNGHKNKLFFIIARLKAKDERPLGESNPRPCAPQVICSCTCTSDTSGLVLPAFQRPGVVADW